MNKANTYRVLNYDQTIIQHTSINGYADITAESYLCPKSFKKAFNLISRHVIHGSSISTCFISSSSNLSTVLNKYYDYQSSEEYIRRIVAVLDTSNSELYLENCAINVLYNKDYVFKNVSLLKENKVKKMTINLSEKKLLNELYLNGLFPDLNNKNRLNGLAEAYSKSDEEIVTLNKIESKKIKYLLEGIEIDIIYFLMQKNLSNGMSYSDKQVISKIMDLGVTNKSEYYMPSNLTQIQKNIYEKHFNKNINIWYIIESMNNDSIEKTVFIREILKIKKEILKKVMLQKFGLIYDDSVFLIEEKILAKKEIIKEKYCNK